MKTLELKDFKVIEDKTNYSMFILYVMPSTMTIHAWDKKAAIEFLSKKENWEKMLKALALYGGKTNG